MNNLWGNNQQTNFSPRNYNYAPLPHYEIIKVNGEAGAQNFRMAPNSSTILADANEAMIWVATTDGAGYLTVTPWDLSPHQTAPQININDLANRVTQLEEILNARQSHSQSNKQSKKQQQQSNTDTAM